MGTSCTNALCGVKTVLLGGPKEGWEVECGIEEADWDQIVLSLIVCAEDFCCYTKNNGKPLGVFIKGHDQICVWRKNGSMIMVQRK